MKKIILLIAGLMFAAVAISAGAQEDKPYKDGPVTVMTYVKVKPGKFDDYMKWLDTAGKPFRDAEVKAGILLGYHVYVCQPRTPHDPDLILSDVYPNMAALDKNDEQDNLAAKQMGARPARAKAAEDREALREILGSEIVREQILK